MADLEGSVEVLRGEVINRRTRVNMAAVEDMALVLSRARYYHAIFKFGKHTHENELLFIYSQQNCGRAENAFSESSAKLAQYFVDRNGSCMSRGKVLERGTRST